MSSLQQADAAQERAERAAAIDNAAKAIANPYRRIALHQALRDGTVSAVTVAQEIERVVNEARGLGAGAVLTPDYRRRVRARTMNVAHHVRELHRLGVLEIHQRRAHGAAIQTIYRPGESPTAIVARRLLEAVGS